MSLQAMDIVLICIGSVVIFLVFSAFLLYLFIKWQQTKRQQKPIAAQNVAKNYNLDRPPSIKISSRTSATQTTVTMSSFLETYLSNDETQERWKAESGQRELPVPITTLGLRRTRDENQSGFYEELY
ncbi:unnamed protein product [Cylicocyclus nassatus]|uniref:Uncharacterized protein n=1 Tax=Cylicocyclus nassatus TaxID=53992 RepID=A0AA36DTT4_CYLNA|nr:unnamed protein product [Cylicocyclus nassatus]